MGYMKMDEMEEYLQDHIKERQKHSKELEKKSKSKVSRFLYSSQQQGTLRRSGRTPFHIAFPTILALVLGTTYLISRTLHVELEEESEVKMKKKEMGDMQTFYGKVSPDVDSKNRMEVLEQRWRNFENKRVPRPEEEMDDGDN